MERFLRLLSENKKITIGILVSIVIVIIIIIVVVKIIGSGDGGITEPTDLSSFQPTDAYGSPLPPNGSTTSCRRQPLESELCQHGRGQWEASRLAFVSASLSLSFGWPVSAPSHRSDHRNDPGDTCGR